jgi:hypothetical protein
MFAPDGRHAAPEAPRLADLPHDQRQRTGVRRQAPQRRTTTGDRIAEARASTGLTHPMHQAHRRRRAPGRPPPAQDPRRAPGGVEGGRARQSESPSTDAGFVQSRIPCHLRV